MIFISLTIRDGTAIGFAERAQTADPAARATSEISGVVAGSSSNMSVDLQVGDESWTGSLTANALSIEIAGETGQARRIEFRPGTVDTFNEELDPGM